MMTIRIVVEEGIVVGEVIAELIAVVAVAITVETLKIQSQKSFVVIGYKRNHVCTKIIVVFRMI